MSLRNLTEIFLKPVHDKTYEFYPLPSSFKSQDLTDPDVLTQAIEKNFLFVAEALNFIDRHTQGPNKEVGKKIKEYIRRNLPE